MRQLGVPARQGRCSGDGRPEGARGCVGGDGDEVHGREQEAGVAGDGEAPEEDERSGEQPHRPRERQDPVSRDREQQGEAGAERVVVPGRGREGVEADGRGRAARRADRLGLDRRHRRWPGAAERKVRSRQAPEVVLKRCPDGQVQSRVRGLL